MSLSIDDAFVQAFIDEDFGLPIAHENMAYEPTAQTAYAEIFVIPGPRRPLSIVETDETSGIFRVILRYPVDSGSITAKTKAEAIIAAFPVNSTVTSGSQTARVTSIDRSRGYPEDGWYKLTVTILYQAFITR